MSITFLRIGSNVGKHNLAKPKTIFLLIWNFRVGQRWWRGQAKPQTVCVWGVRNGKLGAQLLHEAYANMKMCRGEKRGFHIRSLKLGQPLLAVTQLGRS